MGCSSRPPHSPDTLKPCDYQDLKFCGLHPKRCSEIKYCYPWVKNCGPGESSKLGKMVPTSRHGALPSQHPRVGAGHQGEEGGGGGVRAARAHRQGGGEGGDHHAPAPGEDGPVPGGPLPSGGLPHVPHQPRGGRGAQAPPLGCPVYRQLPDLPSGARGGVHSRLYWGNWRQWVRENQNACKQHREER